MGHKRGGGGQELLRGGNICQLWGLKLGTGSIPRDCNSSCIRVPLTGSLDCLMMLQLCDDITLFLAFIKNFVFCFTFIKTPHYYYYQHHKQLSTFCSHLPQVCSPGFRAHFSLVNPPSSLKY